MLIIYSGGEKLMLRRILSGGQTGVDENSLRAAKFCGFETGGWLPKNCWTLNGSRPDLLVEYNMKESNLGYAGRTEKNVKDSDGTIRIAEDFSSSGEKCTLAAIKWFNKPHLDIDIKNPKEKEEVLSWIKENNIKTLNIAGNSEKTSPGIGDFAFNYLVRIFQS